MESNNSLKLLKQNITAKERRKPMQINILNQDVQASIKCAKTFANQHIYCLLASDSHPQLANSRIQILPHTASLKFSGERKQVHKLLPCFHKQKRASMLLAEVTDFFTGDRSYFFARRPSTDPQYLNVSLVKGNSTVYSLLFSSFTQCLDFRFGI